MQNFFKTTITLCMALLGSLQLQAQHAVTGKLVNNEEGVAYANVVLLQAGDSALVTGAVSDDKGAFQIAGVSDGHYMLAASAIGFQKYVTSPFDLNGSDKSFGTISMQEDNKVLDAVEVRGMRPTIIQEAGKMVVKVEGSAMTEGSTALEVLSKSPGVWIDQDGNVVLNGKGGVKVFIDGKPTYMSATDLNNYLSSMPADNIKNIEIINNPSAKYDAEGVSGIINIQLKKNTLEGVNGSVYGGYEYNNKSGYFGGASVNMKNGAWNGFVDADYSLRNRGRNMFMNRFFYDQSDNQIKYAQHSVENTQVKTPTVRAGVDYQLNERSTFGIQGSYFLSDESTIFDSKTNINYPGVMNDSLTTSYNQNNSNFDKYSVSAHYSNKLDTLGTEISADADYARYGGADNSRYTNVYKSLYNTSYAKNELLKGNNPSAFDIYSAKVDFVKPLVGIKGKLEAGAKGSYVRSDNELKFYHQEGSNWQTDDKRSNHFIYNETITAGYVNFSYPFAKNWSLKTGLRAEHTHSVGDSKTTGDVNTRDYLDFFPSVFLHQQVSKNYAISYAYSRRISRPQYQNLNPFLFFIDSYTSAQGNPDLKPQYTNSFEVTNTFKNMYMLSLRYAKTRDVFTEIPTQDAVKKTTVFQQTNLSSLENWGLTLSVPVTIGKFWSMNNNVVMTYNAYDTKVHNLQYNASKVVYNLMSNNNFLLPGGIKVEATAMYMSPFIHGVYNIDGFFWMDAAIKKSFMHDKLNVSLSGNDIFHTRKISGFVDSQDMDLNINQKFFSQSVKLTIRYNFSRGEKFKINKHSSASQEEQNRVGK